MEEIWKDIVGYEGLYQVSNMGRIKNIKRGTIRVPRKQRQGYELMNLSRDHKISYLYIHRIVWEAFNGPIPDGLEIDHKDGTKNNNKLCNLRVVTKVENINNPVTRERYLLKMKALHESEAWREKQREGARKNAENPLWRENQRNGTRKSNSKPVLQIDCNTNKLIKKWDCASDACRELGISNSGISSCCNGRSKTAGGYKWKFA